MNKNIILSITSILVFYIASISSAFDVTFINPFPNSSQSQNYNGTNNHPGIDYSTPTGSGKIYASNYGFITGIDDTNQDGNRYVESVGENFRCYAYLDDGFTVDYASGQNWGGYNFVYIRHLIETGDLVYSKYLHLLQNSIVVPNQTFVSKGQFIALEGRSGCSTSYHLHFEIGKTQPPSNL